MHTSGHEPCFLSERVTWNINKHHCTWVTQLLTCGRVRYLGYVRDICWILLSWVLLTNYKIIPSADPHFCQSYNFEYHTLRSVSLLCLSPWLCGTPFRHNTMPIPWCSHRRHLVTLSCPRWQWQCHLFSDVPACSLRSTRSTDIS